MEEKIYNRIARGKDLLRKSKVMISVPNKNHIIKYGELQDYYFTVNSEAKHNYEGDDGNNKCVKIIDLEQIQLNFYLTDLIVGFPIISNNVEIYINGKQVEYAINDNNYIITNFNDYSSLFTLDIILNGTYQYDCGDDAGIKYYEYRTYTTVTNYSSLVNKTIALSRKGADFSIYMDWVKRSDSEPGGTHDIDTHVNIYYGEEYKGCIYHGITEYEDNYISVKLNRDDVTDEEIYPEQRGETISIDYKKDENGKIINMNECKKYAFYYILYDYTGGTIYNSDGTTVNEPNIFYNSGAYVDIQGNNLYEQFYPSQTDEHVNIWRVFSLNDGKITIKNEYGVSVDSEDNRVDEYAEDKWRIREGI